MYWHTNKAVLNFTRGSFKSAEKMAALQKKIKKKQEEIKQQSTGPGTSESVAMLSPLYQVRRWTRELLGLNKVWIRGAPSLFRHQYTGRRKKSLFNQKYAIFVNETWGGKRAFFHRIQKKVKLINNWPIWAFMDIYR